MRLNFLRKLSKKRVILLVVAIIVVVIGFRLIGGESGVDPRAGMLTRVKLETASQYQSANATVHAIGEVESLEQVEYKSQVSSQVSRVNVSLGEYVQAGQVLVELNHSDIDAQLAQAAAGINRAQASVDLQNAGATNEQIAQSAAAVDSAQAALEQTKANAEASVTSAELSVATAKANLDNSGATSTQSVDNAYTNGLNSARSAIWAAESALNTLTTYQYAYFNCTDDQMCYDLENAKEDAVYSLLGERNAGSWNTASLATLTGGVKGQADVLALVTNPTSEEIQTLLSATTTMLYDMRYALEVLSDNMNTYKAVSATSTDLSTISGAQSSIEGYITSTAAAVQAMTNAELGQNTSSDSLTLAYEQALTNLETAKITSAAMVSIQEAALAQAEAAYDLITADPRTVDLAGLQASVHEAGASYSYLAANRDKYIVTATFSGEVATLPVRVGELVSPSQIIVSVVNDDGLQVKAYINEDDRRLIEEGSAVNIEGGYTGVVTNIAPSIDPTTKKIEIIVAVSESDAVLTIGEFVEIDINMATNYIISGEFYLPFDAVKVTSEAAYVYVVNEENVIEAREVELGRVVGSTIEVTAWLNEDWEIVTSVRGVSEGEEVEPIR